jgi:hypothetical protein
MNNKILGLSEAAKLFNLSENELQSIFSENKKDNYFKKIISIQDLIEVLENRKKIALINNLETSRTLPSDPDYKNKHAENVNSEAKPRVLGRRQFIKTIGLMSPAVVSGLVSGTVSGGGFVYIWSKYKESVVQKNTENLRKKIIKQIFGHSDNYSLSVGLEHFAETYGLENFLRSSNVKASFTLGSYLNIKEEDWFKNANFTDNPPREISIDNNITAIGAPQSDPISKQYLEYSGLSRLELKRVKDPLINLPVEYCVDKNEPYISSSLSKRFVGGIEKSIYNWTLKLNGKLLKPPELDKNRWLKADYLLITRIPNFIIGNALLRSADVLIIAGTHGTGTESISLLLEDIDKLQKISNDINRRTSFQILLPVTQVDHVEIDGEKRTIPVEIGNPQVFPVEIDYEKLLNRFLKGNS